MTGFHLQVLRFLHVADIQSSGPKKAEWTTSLGFAAWISHGACSASARAFWSPTARACSKRRMASTRSRLFGSRSSYLGFHGGFSEGSHQLGVLSRGHSLSHSLSSQSWFWFTAKDPNSFARFGPGRNGENSDQKGKARRSKGRFWATEQKKGDLQHSCKLTIGGFGTCLLGETEAEVKLHDCWREGKFPGLKVACLFLQMAWEGAESETPKVQPNCE